MKNIDKLIALGQGRQDIERNFSWKYLYSLSNIDFTSFSIKDSLNLMRGIAKLELDREKYCFGSTTVIPSLVKNLKLRFAKTHGREVTDLINYLFLYRKNPYIPFGEYIPLEISSIEDYREYLKLLEYEERCLKERQKTKAKVLKVVDEERKRVIRNLKKRKATGRLRYIIDSPQPLDYFADELAELKAEEFITVPREVLEQILPKLKTAKRGSAWEELRKVIVSHLSEKVKILLKPKYYGSKVRIL